MPAGIQRRPRHPRGVVGYRPRMFGGYGTWTHELDIRAAVKAGKRQAAS